MADRKRPAMWAFLLFGLTLMQAASIAEGQADVRLCVVGSEEYAQCQKMVAVLASLPGHPSWSCVQEADREACVLAVGNSQADTLVAEPQDIVHAYMQFGMQPSLAEVYGSGTPVYSTAVVDKTLCDQKPTLSLADLAGKRACFSGYGDGSSWELPLGTLLDSSIMQPVNRDPAISNDIETVGAFFAASCAPGLSDSESICTACPNNCSTVGPFSGQAGALQCLSRGSGDVAFLRSDTLQNSSAEIRYSYRFVCPSGGCQTFNQPLGDCHLAQIPASALLTRRFYDASPIQSTLTSAAADPDFQALFMTGANPTGLIFSTDLSGFANVTASQLDYVGTDALRAYEVFDALQGAPLQSSAQLVTENENANLVPPPPLLKWCTTSDAEQAVCASMAVILQANVNPAYTWGCIQVPSISDCLPAIQNGTADFATLDGTDVLIGSSYYDLKPFVYEVYGQQNRAGSDIISAAGGAISAVAVVKKELCDVTPRMGFQDLQGRSSCHPYYRQDAGWVAPVGFLLDSGFLPTINTDFQTPNDLESVQTFFTRVCAPGDDEIHRACTGCAGNCTGDDAYAGDAGALNCLMNGGGDVAFVEIGAVTNYAKGGPLAQKWANTTLDGLRLLCPDVGCVEIGQMTSDCVLATVPPRAVVTRGNMAIGVPGQILLNATRDRAFQALFFGGTNAKDAIFRVDVRGLAPVTSSTADFLGANTLEAYGALLELDTAPVATNIVRWCTVGWAEFQQCLLMLPALQGQEPSLNWECILRNATQACIDTVTSGGAEVVMLDGNHMVNETGSGRMVPTVSESYDSLHSLTYRAVAVVHKSFCEGEPKTLRDLRGKASCHGSTLSAYGWTVPVGNMLRSGVMAPVNGDPRLPNDIESVEHFFSKSCAPGESDSQRICSACIGDCGVHTETYFGSAGAFRCLLEGAGDVAFVRHTTPGDYALGGAFAQPWSTLPVSDFQLLCPNGGCADIGQEGTCSFADVPGASLLARPAVSADALALLKSALVEVGMGTNPMFTYLYEAGKNPSSLIFDANLRALNEVNVSVSDFLASTKLDFASFETLSTISLQKGVASKHGHRGLGAGAIVGILFGVLGGVALIIGASFLVWKKKFLEKNSFRRFTRTEGKMKLTAL